jgi:hypothetical protein
MKSLSFKKIFFIKRVKNRKVSSVCSNDNDFSIDFAIFSESLSVISPTRFKMQFRSRLHFRVLKSLASTTRSVMFIPGCVNPFTYISHLQNFIRGVSKPYFLRFYVRGIGYKVWSFFQNKVFKLRVGLNHNIFCIIPNGVVGRARKYKFICTSIDYEKLKNFSTKIVSIKPPDPYRNKGIRFINDVVRFKVRKERRK